MWDYETGKRPLHTINLYLFLLYNPAEINANELYFYASAAATLVSVLRVKQLLHILQLGQNKMNVIGEWMTVQLGCDCIPMNSWARSHKKILSL